MIAFMIRRIIQALIVICIISVIGFAIKQSVGDPIREMTGISVSAAELDEFREKLGLNDPWYVQYGRFLRNAMHGDLGNSYFYKRPATAVILEKAPATLELVLVSSLIIIVFSVPLGIFCAIYPRNLLSRFLMSGSVVGVSIPVFLTAIMMVYIFSIKLGWLPSYGRGDLVDLWGWRTGLLTLDGWRHILMPSVALSSIMLPLFIRLIRSEMMEVLESEYVKYAWAKGLNSQRVWFVHAFKNTLLPVITVGGVQLGVTIAFTILTETVFQWQGLGFMFMEAVERSDAPLLVAYLMFVGIVMVGVNTVVDMIYGLVNPTIRIAGVK